MRRQERERKRRKIMDNQKFKQMVVKQAHESKNKSGRALEAP
jgi:hypothetical protein